MASLFQGNPQTATSYVTTTSETPKWMQDAIYNQIQWATNVANRPYEAYEMPTVAGLTPLQQQAYSKIQANQGSWADALAKAQGGMYDVARTGTAGGLQAAQQQYARPDLAKTGLETGQNLYGQAAGMDIVGAGAPFLKQAGQTTAEALSERALSAANPYLQAASRSAAENVGQYMNPYQQGVMNVIAQQGARNLRENLLPAVSESFIKAGQFGSSRMGEFGERALRDTQEAILAQQAQAAGTGYSQALTAAQADLARQAGLAGTVGSISGADLSRMLSGGAQYGSLGSTAGQLTAEQMRNLTALGGAQTAAGQAQQTFGLGASQAVQQAQAQDQARKLSALQSMAGTAEQGQRMATADVAALEAAGQSQQAQEQKRLDAARQQYMEAQYYPQQQLDWLSTQIRGLAPITPQTQIQSGQTTGAIYGPSPLQQFATAYYGGKALGGI